MTTLHSFQARIDLPELPDNWIYRPVSALGMTGEQTVLTGPFGTNIGREDFVSHGVPVLTIGCLTEKGISLDKALFVSEAKAKELGRYRLKEGDLLFSRMASVGRAGLVPKSLSGALFNYHIMRLRLDKSQIDPRVFIYYVRGAQQVRDYLKAVSHGATRAGINTQELLELPVAVPPLLIQEGIVAEIEKQFSFLDEAVANLKRVKANLKRYKAAVLKAAVEGRLVETEAELARREGRSYESGEQLMRRVLDTRRSKWTGKGKFKEPAAPDERNHSELPEGWVMASVEQMACKVEYGSSAKTSEDSSGIPVLRMGNLVEGEIVLDELKYLPRSHDEFPKLLLKAGDLLFNRTNSPELVGKSAVFEGAPEECSFASYLIRVRLVQGIQPRYLAAFINSALGRAWIKSVVTQQVGQANVNGTKLQALNVPLPPTDEQLRIVAELERRLSLVLKLEGQIEANLRRADRFRQSILCESFGPKTNKGDARYASV